MVLKFIKPSPLKIIITTIFVLWVYFYQLQVFKSKIFTESLFLVKEGAGFIEWGSPVFMKLSYGSLWIIVTLVIFTLMILFDRVYTSLHNFLVLRGYIKQKSESSDLVKKAELAIRHRRFLIYWVVVILMIYVSLFYLSYYSVFLSENLLWKYIYYATERQKPFLYLIVLIPFWYLVSVLLSVLITVEKKEEQEEKITEEHDATETAF